MKIKEEKHCIVCNKLLVRNQKKFCSKECEVKYKKGRPVGPYSEERISNIVAAKRKSYEEKNFKPFLKDIKYLLSQNYISNSRIIARKIGMELTQFSKYLEHYPEDKQILKNTPRFTQNIQSLSPENFRSLKSEILSKKATADICKELTIKYNINLRDVVDTYFKITGINGFEDISLLNRSKNPKDFCSIEEFQSHSNSLKFKYQNIKKKFEKDKVENIFKDTLKFKSKDDYDLFLLDLSKSYGCRPDLLKRYLKEKSIKPKVEYYYLKFKDRLCKKLNTSENNLDKILEDLLRENDYLFLRKKYEDLYKNYESIYQSLYKNPFQTFITDMEKLDDSGKLILIKRNFYENHNNSESYILLKYGYSFLQELREDVRKIDNVDNFSIFYEKYCDRIKFDSLSMHNLFKSINPDILSIKDLYFNNRISNDGGSSIEKKIISYLEEIGANFETQVKLKGDNKNSLFKIDIVLNKKICIEIQGDYWHSNPLFFKHSFQKINSVFPYFKYKEKLSENLKDVNEIQKQGLEKDCRKYRKMIDKFGYNNIYYIWEYDINNHFEEVKEFLRGLI